MSASLITSRDAVWSIVVSTRLSRASLICTPVGLFAVTVALLDTMPLLTAVWSMVYSTVYVADSPTAKVPSVAVFELS